MHMHREDFATYNRFVNTEGLDYCYSYPHSMRILATSMILDSNYSYSIGTVFEGLGPYSL
jgi:hypothetical protein